MLQPDISFVTQFALAALGSKLRAKPFGRGNTG
jgi:hypothetical protein